MAEHTANTERERIIRDLTCTMMHQHYCENDVDALISRMTDDILWLGAAEHEMGAGQAVAETFRRFAGQVPRCNLSEEDYRVLGIAPNAYLCTGRMWIATDPATGVALRVHQRFTLVFRWTETGPMCCHIHISNPYSEMEADDVGFPTKMAQQSYEYLQEQVAAQKQHLEEQTLLLRRMSYEDTLTGLYNRNKFNQLLQADQISDSPYLGVACFDLNGLKQVNDQQGHSAGDAFICSAADQLRRVFPGKIYRIGGDEFVVMDDTPEAEFLMNVRAVQTGMAKHNISCSVGMCWRQEGRSVQEQFDEADRRMYQAKRLFYSTKANDRRKH